MDLNIALSYYVVSTCLIECLITHPATFSINPALHHWPVLCVNNSDLRLKLINPDLERCPWLKTVKKNVPFHIWNTTLRCYSFQWTYHAFHSNLWRSLLLVTTYFIFSDGKTKTFQTELLTIAPSFKQWLTIYSYRIFQLEINPL